MQRVFAGIGMAVALGMLATCAPAQKADDAYNLADEAYVAASDAKSRASALEMRVQSIEERLGM